MTKIPNDDLQIFLKPTFYFDSEAPEIIQFAEEVAGNAETDADKAVRLFYAVRDGIVYDPLQTDMRKEALKASMVLKKKIGFCISKSSVLITASRALGIPARLKLAAMRNHHISAKFKQILQTDVIHYYGYAELFLGKKWIKAGPAFDRSFCDVVKVAPLDFDGKSDSMFTEFDRSGGKFYEYLHDHGHFSDFPFDEIQQSIKHYYPHLTSEILLVDFKV